MFQYNRCSLDTDWLPHNTCHQEDSTLADREWLAAEIDDADLETLLLLIGFMITVKPATMKASNCCSKPSAA